jgi:hypothetical protein
MYGGTAAALPVFAEVVDTIAAIAVATASATTTERLILPPLRASCRAPEFYSWSGPERFSVCPEASNHEWL